MNPLQIHILAGVQAGARLQLNQPPVTFGRSGDCTLVLDLPVVSRLHGELQVDEAGQWILVNHSSNGTRVGRKNATKKPVPLTDGATINIGDTEVFRVYLAPVSETDAPPQDKPDDKPAQPKQQAPGAGLKGRSKLWIGLGAWFALCIVAMIFLATLGGNQGNGSNSSSTEFYNPRKQVEGMQGDEAGIEAIRRLLAEPPPRENPNTTRYDEALDRAARASDAGTAELYEAYRQYQIAISYSDSPSTSDPFDDEGARIRYDRVVKQLAEIIYERYMYAYRSYHSGDYQTARDILEKLRMDFYRTEDPHDNLANHIRQLRNAAHRRAD